MDAVPALQARPTLRLACLALLAALAGIAETGQVRAQMRPVVRDGVGLKLQHDLIDPARRAQEVVPAFGAADEMTGVGDEVVEMRGRAQLRKNGSVINADFIRYVEVEDEVFALGSVRIVRDGDVITGPEMRLRQDVRTGYFLEPYYERADGTSRGKAERIDFQGPERMHLTNSFYTTCTLDNLDWYVTTSELDIDDATQTGSGRNGVVVFKGVPIFASPWLTFPLSHERKTGFLPPTFSLTSRSGPEFMAPFYWNIAPQHDLTVYPKYIGLRGLQLGGSFRYLEPTYRGTVRAEYLPNDKQAGIPRYSIAATNTFASGPWSGLFDINKVSDDNYFVDFSRTIAAASQRNLPRLASVTYGSGFWSVTTQIQRYQTLQDPANPITKPYERLPSILMHGERRDLNGFDFVVDTDVTHFANPTQVNGNRFVAYPKLSYPYIAPGWFITPKLGLHMTRYGLSNVTTPGDPTDLSRTLPIASVETGLVFERDTTLFGRNLRQTLEPRLFYVRTPFRDQSRFPVFDTGLPDLSFAQLFSENPFSGSDRIADANQLTVAVVTRYLDAASGAELIRAAIGQRLYLSPQRVVLPGTLPVNQSSSDFLGTLSASVLPGLTVEGGAQYSQQVDAVVRATAGVRYRPEAGKVLNGAYRYLRDNLRQADVSGQWPIGGGWHAVGRLNYSFRDKQVIENLGGVEYEACCWIARAFFHRFATATGKATTTLFFQLELKGFSRIGTNPLDAIRRNVPGYSVLNPHPPAMSPFQNYE